MLITGTYVVFCVSKKKQLCLMLVMILIKESTMIKAYAAFEAGDELRPFEYDPGPLKGKEVEVDVR